MKDILDAFEQTENAAKIKEARDNAGNDMLKMMQIVFPVTTQIQMEVIKKYGFSGDGEGEPSLNFLIRLSGSSVPVPVWLNGRA